MRRLSLGRSGKRAGLAGFLGVAFFLFLADAILSNWAPGFIQGVTGSPLIMGAVISFSSVVGLVMDLVFAEILGGSRVKKLVWWALLGCLVFAGLWKVVLIRPWVWLMLLAMAAWGFYYDLFGFFTQQFVAENTGKQKRAAVWGVVAVVRNLAYFAGPVVGTSLLSFGNEKVVSSAVGTLVIAGLLLAFIKIGKAQQEFAYHKIGMRAEIEHWRVLFGRVWPILAMSLVLGWIDATYWTTGTIVSEMLAKENWWGGMFLPFYILPSLLVGMVVSKWKIKEGKKRAALKLLIGAGVSLALLDLYGGWEWKLAIVLFSSTLIAICWPLVNAVYTDLIVRMGREREHLVGLSDSMMNIAYIAGPIAAGGITMLAGETGTFVAVGTATAAIGLGLWVVMPRKLRLPQREMIEWQNEEFQSTEV